MTAHTRLHSYDQVSLRSPSFAKSMPDPFTGSSARYRVHKESKGMKKGSDEQTEKDLQCQANLCGRENRLNALGCVALFLADGIFSLTNDSKTGNRFGHGGSLAALNRDSALATLGVGILPGRHKPHVRVRDVNHLSCVDCCLVDSGGTDEPHRSHSISATSPGRVVCGRMVLLECAGEGNSTPTLRNGTCIAFTVSL